MGLLKMPKFPTSGGTLRPWLELVEGMFAHERTPRIGLCVMDRTGIRGLLGENVD